MKVESRLIYPDILKLLAIFLVTWSHSAQCVSGETWTNFFGGNQIDIAINMPLFMIISGWFINIDKIRSSKTGPFIFSKFKRLLIPSFCWYLIHQTLAFHLPSLSIFTYYWYLNSLFICFCIIIVSAKLIKNNKMCIIVSTIVVILLPYSDFCHVNFMYPYLWGGICLKDFMTNTMNTTQRICYSFIFY